MAEEIEVATMKEWFNYLYKKPLSTILISIRQFEALRRSCTITSAGSTDFDLTTLMTAVIDVT